MSDRHLLVDIGRNVDLFHPWQKEAQLLVALVCLLVSNITHKVMNGLQYNFMEGSGVVQGRTD